MLLKYLAFVQSMLSNHSVRFIMFIDNPHFTWINVNCVVDYGRTDTVFLSKGKRAHL